MRKKLPPLTKNLGIFRTTLTECLDIEKPWFGLIITPPKVNHSSTFYSLFIGYFVFNFYFYVYWILLKENPLLHIVDHTHTKCGKESCEK